MAKTENKGKKLKVEKEIVEKTILKKEALKLTYKGKVIVNKFSIKDKTYKLGDEYITDSKFNYDTLIKQKRIK